MRRLFRISLLFSLLSFFVFSGLVSAQDVDNFAITSFSAQYNLTRNEQKTALLQAVETIVAEFPNFNQNHGILRAIPMSYEGHTLSLHIQSVKNQTGQDIPYTTYKESNNLVLKIGNPNAYVRGKQTYVISYSMKNVVKFFEDHEEFYWNINGTQWRQPMGKVSLVLRMPADIGLNLQSDRRCFAGSIGSKNTCAITVDTQEDDTIVKASAENVGPRQTMTIALGFGKGTFIPGPEIAQEKRREILMIIGILLLLLGLPLLTLAFLIHKWRKYGRDPKGRGVIVPEYQPPKNISVLKSDYVLEEGLRTEAVTALLIELAVKKYLVIYETEKKRFLKKTKQYDLELVKDPTDLSAEQQDVVKMIFGDNPVIGARKDLDMLKNKLAAKVSQLDKDTSTALAEEGYFTNSPANVRKKYYRIGGVVLAGGVVLTVTGLLLIPGIGIILSGIVVLMFARAMPARSAKGVTLRDYLKGLKDYIKMAEADRLRFLQSPEGAEKIKESGVDPLKPSLRVKLFEDLLPYAILFGLEKEWAKQFADIYKEAPEWYRGNVTTFNAVYLASSVNSLSAASAAAFTAPSSSGSSGLGGGGFSGGGGGGGGGGGW